MIVYRSLCYTLYKCIHVQVKWYSTEADCFKGIVLLSLFYFGVKCVNVGKLCCLSRFKIEEFLQGERKLSVLAGYSIVFMLHVIGVYWWYQNDDLCYPLFMVPPKAIPPFWNAIFIIIVNGTVILCNCLVSIHNLMNLFSKLGEHF